VLEGSDVLGLVEAIPAVEGASFFPQAIQLGDDQLDDPQPPVLQPVVVSAVATVSPRANERTIRERDNVQCIVGVLSQTHRFSAPPVGETGECLSSATI